MAGAWRGTRRAQGVVRGKAWGFAGKDEAFGFRSQCSQVPGNFEHRGENGLQEHRSGSCGS